MTELEYRRNSVWTAVWTAVEYAKYLEFGWHSSKGNFFRYPFMVPAAYTVLPWASREAARIFRDIGQSGTVSSIGVISFE